MASSDLTFEIEKDFQFEAAHYFEHDDANELFKKIHGHSFRGTVRVEGDAQEEKGWIRDLWKIERIIQEVIKPLDHALLNEVEGFATAWPELRRTPAPVLRRTRASPEGIGICPAPS